MTGESTIPLTGLRPSGNNTGPGPSVSSASSWPDKERSQPVLEVIDVVKQYGQGEASIYALAGVSLTIEQGDFVAIMGSSGSGKSTLMHILGCLDIPTFGRYLLEGIDVKNLNERQLSLVRNRLIGFVFQSFNLVPRTSALSNVELPLTYAGVGRSERRRRAIAALKAVGLDDRLRNLPSQLSGGQQQRVAVARALVTEPALVLADEPTGNLDSTSTAEVLTVFERLNAEGRTVVIITHEPEVAEHAKRVLRLRDGLLVEDFRQASVKGPPPLYRPHSSAGTIPA